ncbi:HlyD family secretion protein [Phenylobacterium soli]|uniref:Secretion protein HlyD n=1 Tax=Phenylobacterium soli TaxID=2170551 RepID=A0A328AC19_9CAUL|nr:HlyD family efflux transporter periplasmic adaptor subunit [Phenylobacterium soli]RAK51746.1 secretion protein HlyD [Phenylobacterium soli]
MNRQRILVAVLLVLALAIVGGLVLMPRFSPPRTLTGYVEGEPLYLAAPVAGTVTAMRVARGDEVNAGAELFAIDPKQVISTRDQAAAETQAAEAQATDVRKGQRPVEIAVYEANIAAAEARARDAEAQFRRVAALAAKGFESRAALDDARASAQAAEAQAAAARRQRDAATLGARADQIRAADARVRQAQASLAGASARLADIAPKAPESARVEDVFFQQGEWAPANQPILSLLPDSRIYVKVFVPEQALSAYRVGRTIRFSCDGCAKGLTARITYVSPRPEFTPPVIYSRDARDRLVYQIRALPSVRLNPGQPVDVLPLEAGR